MTNTKSIEELRAKAKSYGLHLGYKNRLEDLLTDFELVLSQREKKE